LTGYDNRDAVSGKPDQEVYLYDAFTGHLVCASCNPTGARPVGKQLDNEHATEAFLGGERAWESNKEAHWLAAILPGWTEIGNGVSLYQPRYLSDSGRLFFNSDDALVPQDVNGTWDVYEYEPPGVPEGEHACTSASATFSGRSGGCVGLISSGTSARESAFLDASEGGGDVFFLTSARLLPQDFDTALDVYDAHECTGASPCFPSPAVQPPPCGTADSCKAAQTPQPSIFGEPSSATFNGQGNVTPAGGRGSNSKKTAKCKSPEKLSHRKCVKQVRPAHKGKKHRVTKSNRRVK